MMMEAKVGMLCFEEKSRSHKPRNADNLYKLEKKRK